MPRIFLLLGSLKMAVVLLIAIAAVLAWGTFYEVRFGTAAVQRFLYVSWWFQSLLAFLALNLATAAIHRYPWKRKHIPFVLAHIGIILLLAGGIIGGRFGIEGQLIIPEGQTNDKLLLPGKLLDVHRPNPGLHIQFPTRFETTAWDHTPDEQFDIPLKEGAATLTVDRYFPNAVPDEKVMGGGSQPNPAIELSVRQGERTQSLWLFSRRFDRFGAQWGRSHLLFLEPSTPEQLKGLLEGVSSKHPLGTVTFELPGSATPKTLAVPERLGQTQRIKGTAYSVTFERLFFDFAMTEAGPVDQSGSPRNPAVVLTLTGPEGTDNHLLFAFHPGFSEMHGRTHAIDAKLTYHHPADSTLPPHSTAFLQTEEGLALVLTGHASEREVIESVALGQVIEHPWEAYSVEVIQHESNARLMRSFKHRSDNVRAEVIHVKAQLGESQDQGWVQLGGSTELEIGAEPVVVGYHQSEWSLPVEVKLLDFRRIDYPGTQMASNFESDVILTDAKRGVTLNRTIKMNTPMKYRGFTFFQSSYFEEPVETTVLSVRNDPGMPLVYGGCGIIVLGVVGMFVFRGPNEKNA